MEVRRSYLDGSISFITPHRKKRPHSSTKETCPFCRGKEHLNPKTIDQYPKKGMWKIRVFENKYPILSPNYKATTRSKFYSSIKAFGYHEVVIDHYKHEKRFWQFSKKHIENWLKILIKRYKELKSKPKIKYVFIFKNSGNSSAASITHEHSQILASSFLPPRIKEKMRSLKRYHKNRKKCLLCELSRTNDLVIKKNKHFSLVYNPVPLIENQMIIVPKRHFSELDEIRKNEINDLAKILKYSIRFTTKRFSENYNLAFFSFPERRKFLHFHIEIFPRNQIYGAIELALKSYVISSL